MGVGIFIQGHRAGLNAQYRSFWNKERQSGFFWGFYGLAEWRRMYWYYNGAELNVASSFPFWGQHNVYHSLGITGGMDIGFRFRGQSHTGITPYIGFGVPVFFYFGGKTPEHDTRKFNELNTFARAIRFGLKVDFFAP